MSGKIETEIVAVPTATATAITIPSDSEGNIIRPTTEVAWKWHQTSGSVAASGFTMRAGEGLEVPEKLRGGTVYVYQSTGGSINFDHGYVSNRNTV